MNEWLREILLLPRQKSTVAAEIDHLHYFVIGVTMLGAVSVALIAAIFVIRYRESKRREGPQRPVREFFMPLKLEFGLIAMLALLFFGWWWIGIRQYMRVRIAPPNPTEVYVMAKQWMFKFSYPEGNSSVHTLYIPAGRPIKLVMTSRDVIHAFYVPEFRVKQDIVPGRYTSTWFEAPEPGSYDILCTEFCGTGHSEMRGRVVVLSPEDYQAFLEGTREPRRPGIDRASDLVDDADLREGPNLVDVGETVAAQQGCLRCHTTDGSPHIGPSFAGLFGRPVVLTNGRELIADEAYITESIMDPMEHIHQGFQPVMPSYKGLLEPGEVAGLVELIKSLRDADRPPFQPTRAYPPPAAEGVPLYPAPTQPEPEEARP